MGIFFKIQISVGVKTISIGYCNKIIICIGPDHWHFRRRGFNLHFIIMFSNLLSINTPNAAIKFVI